MKRWNQQTRTLSIINIFIYSTRQRKDEHDDKIKGKYKKDPNQTYRMKNTLDGITNVCGLIKYIFSQFLIPLKNIDAR